VDTLLPSRRVARTLTLRSRAGSGLDPEPGRGEGAPMKAKQQIESNLNSATMLDGTGDTSPEQVYSSENQAANG